jgi:FAD/FMN-containing dehydrogenase
LEETIRCLDDNSSSTYSVAWVDAATAGEKLGRSLVMLGEHASQSIVKSRQISSAFSRPRFNIPFPLPTWVLNPLTAKVFNTIYYHVARENDSTSLVDIDRYFYPLDKIGKWYRIYGSAGLVQYQVVIPMECAFSGMEELFKLLPKSSERSFLTVMKIFGEENEGWLSFPKRGITVTLDFKQTDKSLKLMDELDEVVQRYGGRSYLAKDARMKRSFFESGYPRLNEFKDLVSKVDPHGKFRSVQSERLGIK